MGADDPEERLTDREGALKLWDCGVGWKRLPEVSVFGAAVSAGGEEQAGRTDGQIVEVGGVCTVGPSAAVEDEGEVTRDGDAHARSVL